MPRLGERVCHRCGAQLRPEIFRGIHTGDAFLVLLSRASLRSEHVRREVGPAVDSNRHILPVALEPRLLDAPDMPEDWLSGCTPRR